MDLGVAQAGLTRRPAQTFETSVDVEEGQVASKCRMHDRFLWKSGFGFAPPGAALLMSLSTSRRTWYLAAPT